MNEPDIGFQAGFGFYLGIVVTGIVAIAALVAGATTATLLGVLPSTVTLVAIVGHIFAKRTRGLPERIGGNRWQRLACYVPAAAFAAALFLPALAPIEATSRFVIVTIAVILLTGVSGFGLERMAKNRYVDAITADEPAATWTWHRSGIRCDEHVMNVFMALTIVFGLGMAWAGNVYGLLWAVYGSIFLLLAHSDIGEDWYDFDPTDRWNPPEIRAHEAGLVVKKSYGKTFVAWDEIEAVRLTDEELVLERSRWLDIRCDRAALDDPEVVLEEIQRARERAERSRTPGVTH
ncbi:PH domain-containing protein [Natronorubrum sp. FCH18a]|uniref:PH domain-containing protein n=1 Tax=Natronorubrum sp. FCH18a TaxID=3447018 RepID=UPI003F50F1FB